MFPFLRKSHAHPNPPQTFGVGMILVTSATGTVGSEIVKQLKAQGLAVTAASRNPGKAGTDLGVPAVAWHWDQPRSFGEALSGVHTLFLGTPPGTTEELAWGLS